MDVKIWEKTILAWLNSINSSLIIDSLNQINDSYLKEVIRKINLNSESSPVEFLKEVFPYLTESDSFKLSLSVDYLCASTLLLIYVSLSKKEDLKEIRDLMCVKLDTSTQLNIVEFLNNIQQYEDIFNFSFKKIKQEIFPNIFLNFKEKHFIQNSVVGDGAQTPVKNDTSSISFDSPLQGFFQTPKRKANKHTKSSYNMCGDGDHIKLIKKLTDQIVEEEAEKASLQEQLNVQTQKCNENEMKLKNKIEEIKHLKEEWENEAKKNEDVVDSLKSNITKKLEIETKLKREISHLENYVSSLENDLSNYMSKNDKLENQLKSALERFSANEAQLKETTELCIKLQSSINDKEKELEQFKENYTNFYNDEKTIDVSFMNKSLDNSVCPSENLGVVVDKLLQEKIEENTSLEKTIEELRTEKSSLIDQVKSLNEQLESKNSIISELQFLEKELNTKVENFEKIEKELFKVQNELRSANAEISKLNKENSHIMEKYNILHSKLQEREQSLVNCNNSKMLLQINFLKLAEDFKAVQQRLELEVKNISRLALEKCEELSRNEADSKFLEDFEMKEPKDILTVKSLITQQDINSPRNTEEITFSQYFSFLDDDSLFKFSELLQNFESHVEWMESKASLQKTYNQLNDNIIILKAKLHKLEEHYRNSLEKKTKLENHLKEAEEKIRKIESANSFEILRLKQELVKRENKIKELETSILHSKKVQEELLLEKEVLIQEAKILFKENDPKIIHEGGDHKSIRTVTFDSVTSEVGGKIEAPCQQQEFNDSLEEVPVTNKTFDIVNLEDRNLSDKTFSIKKEDVETLSKNLRNSAWVVSPPSKVPIKVPSKDSVKHADSKCAQSSSWVISFDSVKGKENRVKKVSSSVNDLSMKTKDVKLSEIRKEITEFSKECERLKSALLDVEQKRKKDKEIFEKNQEIIRQNITAKYESQLEHLKNEMKQLYNRELAKHKHEQSSLSSELRDQNKRYKDHIDELRNQLWDLGEKLLQEQTLKRDLERNLSELKEKYEYMMYTKEPDLKCFSEKSRQKEPSVDENVRACLRQIPNATFPTIPTEDEDEVFDNRFLEDMKTGVCKMERPEERLKELQYRNSLCLPHLKSSYPGETQFHNPSLFKETDLKFGFLPFPQESQSLTDSDHSMTKSLLPDSKGKKKEQTSYKRPGPPTPSKNGGRLSVQSGDVKLTPRNVLKELNDQNERNKGTPNPLKLLLTSKHVRRGSMGSKDENAVPITPRKKKFFRKPFGARDH